MVLRLTGFPRAQGFFSSAPLSGESALEGLLRREGDEDSSLHCFAPSIALFLECRRTLPELKRVSLAPPQRAPS